MNLWLDALDEIRSFVNRRTNRGRPDPEKLFVDLAKAHSGRAFSDETRYRDFRAVFLAHPQGKKVLFEILTWSHMFQPVFLPGDPYATHYRDGERNIGLKIMAAINAEPSEELIEAESEPSGDELIPSE